MTTSQTPHTRTPSTLPDAPARTSLTARLTRGSSSAFLAAGGLFGSTGVLLITANRSGAPLFPVALTALTLGAILLAAGLVGLDAGHGHDQPRGGRVAIASCGIVAVSGVVLAALVAVGIVTGGLSSEAPAVIEVLVAAAVLTLAFGLCLALLLVGVGAYRSGTPSRGVGIALMLAAALFLLPVAFEVTGSWPDELVGLAVFATWTAIFGGVGMALRRR